MKVAVNNLNGIVMEKIRLIANIDILPGFEAEVRQAVAALGAESRKEPGCEVFQAHIRKDSPESILIYEVYANENAFEEHKAKAHAAKFFEFVKGRIKDDNIEVVFLTALNG